MPPKRRSPAKAAAFWKGVADVAVDRRRALAELEAGFAAGSVPEGLDGFHRGRLVASTVGYGLDVVVESLSRLWMPWRGKTFDAPTARGANVFDARGRWVARTLWPGYRGYGAFAPGLDTAFSFVTATGPSTVVPGAEVLRIDYDLADNPSWPVRKVLDELVEVDRGLYLGQALLRWKGEWRRAAWFSLESPA